MATVPRYEPQVVAQPGGTPVQQASVSPEAFGLGVSQSLAGLGKELGSVGDELHRNALEIQARANAASADEMAVTYNTEQNKILWGDGQDEPGFYNLGPKDRFSRRDEYEQRIKQLRSDWSGRAGNEQTRQLFDQQTRRDMMITQDNMFSSAATALREFEKDTFNSSLSQMTENIGLARNPEEVDLRLEMVMGKLIEDPYAQKLTDFERLALVQKASREGVSGYLANLARRDPVAAQDLFETKYKDLFDAEQQAKLSLQLESLALPDLVDHAISQELTASGPSGDTLAAAFNDLHLSEGDAIVVDSNGKKVRYGINLGYNPEVNLEKMTWGDAQKIYMQKYWAPVAGYATPATTSLLLDASAVLGPGRAKTIAKQAGGDPDKFRDLYLSYLKTRPIWNKYSKSWTNRVNRAYASGQGATQQAGTTNVTEIMASVREKYPPGRIRRAVEQGIRQRLTEQKQTAQLEETANFETLYGYVRNNQPKSVGEALSDPTFQAAYLKLPETSRERIDDFITQENTVSRPLTEADLLKVDRLKGLATTNPQQFVNTVMEEMKDLPLSAQSDLLEDRRKILFRKTNTNTADPSIREAMNSPPVKAALVQSGILRNNGEFNPKKADVYNTFYGEFSRRIQGAIAANGGKDITREEKDNIALGMFTRYQHLFLGVDTGRRTLEYHPPTEDIPRNEMNRITLLFRSRGIYNPSASDIADYYNFERAQK